jgi:hypothetical protein
MSCDISLGRLEPCKNSIGGLKAVYFVNFGDLGAITYDVTNTDVIDAIAGDPDAHKYDLKGDSTYEEAINSDRTTGTTFFTQTLTLNLKKLSVKDHKELKLLIWGRTNVIVEDNNGNFFIAGLTRGMDVTGGSITTGAALGDMSGYSLTLEGEEPVPANFLGDTLDNVGFTVVVGA